MNEPVGRPLGVALLGCGVVGAEVARQLLTYADDLAARAGAPLRLVGIAVRRADRERPGLPAELFTTDAPGLIARDDVDLVVEVVGGIEPARSWILQALTSGKSVVTANKALLAEDGPTLVAAADDHGTDLYYEAAVAGAIPIVRPMRDSLVGDQVTRVMGIVNGTTNFILDKMHTAGAGFAETLSEAQALGYAEADPTADVEGYDAAAKAAILATLAFHTRVTLDDVYREGITDVSRADIAAAESLGMVVKMLAICELEELPDGGRRVSARVHPAMLPAHHPLASVGGAFNAVFVETEAAGQLMFYGRGAGGAPTASAVLGDLVTVARHRLVGGRGARSAVYQDLEIAPIGDVVTRFHIALEVEDTVGVLAKVAQVLAAHNVSIMTMRQEDATGTARLVLGTHTARNADVEATVDELVAIPEVYEVTSLMRVEGR
ncbi:homoserine dehydrogenase [Raineyella sp. LH-20]|uniref:homoserine dehydrogenase n=1 Tax=Raineyella sp. LH-20 TaxID=3081204 RepID=UPI0029547BB7|nr:homoserine dehydrogenase [Raineyella sp. LH-20]WOP17913.1 homoserine dehydrogenase [Raineyella sp. LH-20]